MRQLVVHAVLAADQVMSGRTDLLQLKAVETGAFPIANIGVLQATCLLSGVGHPKEKIASKMFRKATLSIESPFTSILGDVYKK